MAKKCEVNILEITPGDDRPLEQTDLIMVTSQDGETFLYTFQQVVNSIITGVMPQEIEAEVMAADTPDTEFEELVDEIELPEAWTGWDIELHRTGVKQVKIINSSGYYFTWDKQTRRLGFFPALAKEELISIKPLRK